MQDRPTDSADTKVIGTEDVRQGRTGVGLRYVLIYGMILAVIAWLVVAYVMR